MSWEYVLAVNFDKGISFNQQILQIAKSFDQSTIIGDIIGIKSYKNQYSAHALVESDIHKKYISTIEWYKNNPIDKSNEIYTDISYNTLETISNQYAPENDLFEVIWSVKRYKRPGRMVSSPDGKTYFNGDIGEYIEGTQGLHLCGYAPDFSGYLVPHQKRYATGLYFDAGDARHYHVPRRGGPALLNIERLIEELNLMLSPNIKSIIGCDEDFSLDPRTFSLCYVSSIEALKDEIALSGFQTHITDLDVVAERAYKIKSVKVLEINSGLLLYSLFGTGGNLKEIFDHIITR